MRVEKERGAIYELNQIGENGCYIQSSARIGLVRTGDREVCLTGNGSDKDAGWKVWWMFEKNGWQSTVIYNTRSNAGHIGGDRYLQERARCRIYAPGIERDSTNSPVLEPAFLHGGFPPKDLRHKFLVVQESRAEHPTKETLLAEMEMVPLSGHFFDMVGFRTADDVVYLADCLSNGETLEKYQIGSIYDVGACPETLERARTMSAAMFVPAHAPATDHIASLAQINIGKVHGITEKITDTCREPLCFEQILRRLLPDYGLSMNSKWYVLVGSMVRSYLA